MSRLFDAAIAERALDITAPLVEGLLTETDSAPRIANHNALHAVIGVRDDREGGFEVLAERRYGDQTEPPEEELAAIARAKARISARTGLASREVQLLRPELLHDSDITYWGSAVLGDIVVGCSGIQGWFDESIAATLAWQCRALVQEEVERRLKRDIVYYAD